jgi:hypothetical protein
MDDLEARLRARMVRPTGLLAAREFLQTYVCDSDFAQLEKVVRHMMRVNPITIVDGAEGLESILATEQEPGTYARLVAYDANRDLDDPGDAAAKQWLMTLLDRLREWVKSADAER